MNDHEKENVMSDAITGLHHVTAISGPPQANVDFYQGQLRQRFVKKTVNFDDPGTYHLYYADQAAAPGSVLTFFPFVDAGPGKFGPGMASAVAYALSPVAFEVMMERLAEDAQDFGGPSERFGQRVIILVDPDGLVIEFVEDDTASDDSGGFHSVTLCLDEFGPTVALLEDVMGYRRVGTDEQGRLRLQTPSGGRASVVDLVKGHGRGLSGAGTIHHVAFRALDNADQLRWRARIEAAGYAVTPVIDRQYFNAIYFREPGGVLFEIATDPPGFATDEPMDQLGKSLQLPPQYEARRDDIERRLPPLRVA